MIKPHIRLLNLPWTMTRFDLEKFVSSQIKIECYKVHVLYDLATGLSRGVGVIYPKNDADVETLFKKGSLTIDGRNVLIERGFSKDSVNL